MRTLLPLCTAAVLAGAVLAGCSDDTPSTSAPVPSATTAAPEPTGPAATATPGPSATAAPSSSPTRAAAQDGDVDGDGRADRVTATSDELRVELTSGATLTSPIVDADTEPVVQGVVDVDRDGYGEVFLETARGASTGFVQLWRYDGRRLQELLVRGGHARFGFGGSAMHGEGFSCTPEGRFVVRRADSDDGERYTVRTRTFRVRAAALVLESDRTATARGIDDPRVRAAYQVSCGPVGDAG